MLLTGRELVQQTPTFCEPQSSVHVASTKRCPTIHHLRPHGEHNVVSLGIRVVSVHSYQNRFDFTEIESICFNDYRYR